MFIFHNVEISIYLDEIPIYLDGVLAKQITKESKYSSNLSVIQNIEVELVI